MKALLLPLLLIGADEPTYPLGAPTPRSLTKPGRPFVLTDLRYRMTQEHETAQAFSARVRLANRGFFSAFVDDQRRGLSLQTQRLELGFFDDGSFTNLQGGWRRSRVLVDVGAERRPPQDGRGWVVDGELGLRLSPDLEAFASVLADTDRDRPSPARPLRGERLGVLWQRGTRLDLSAALFHNERHSEAGFDLETFGASAGAAGSAWKSEGEAEIGYERTTGILPREELSASASVRTARERWLAQALSRNRWEPGVRWFEHDLAFGVSLHGRRVRLPRAGKAAQRTRLLSRRANAFGYDERRVYDDDSRRALRERLALSPRRAELAADLEALHRAQIDERSVPLVGVSFAEHVESVTGIRRRSASGFVGVPWLPRWPWQRNEASAPFLKALYAREQARYANGFTSLTDSVALEAELSREMTLAVRWRRPGLTPLDVTFRSGRARRWEVEYVYAFGR